MEPPKKYVPADPRSKAKSETKTGSVYVGSERYTTIGKAALNVSNHLGTGRIVSAGEMAQYLVDNYLDSAWRAYAQDLALELEESSPEGD